MIKLWNDNTDNLNRLYLTFAQTLCKDVWVEVMFLCILLYCLTFFCRDARAVFERTRDRSDRNTKVSGYILHCYVG